MVIGDRIKELAADKGLIIEDFSNLIDVKYRTVQNYIGGVSLPKGDFLIALNEKLGVSPTWLLTGIGDKFTSSAGNDIHNDDNFIQIKRYMAEASAGHGSQVSAGEGTGHYAFNQRWLDRRGLNANSLSVISVRGDSMEPDLYENDLLLLDHSQTDLKDSHIYAVQFSEGLYVKRIQHLPEGQIHLISRNTNYPPITVKHPVADGVQIIGRVVASMHEW